MFVPIALKTKGENYFGGSMSHLPGVLEYTNTTGFYDIDPSEGPITGG